MDEIMRIKKNINNRKYGYKSSKKMKISLYKVSMSILTFFSIIISILIYTKKKPNSTNEVINKIGLDIDMSKINENITNYFDNVVGLDFIKKSIWNEKDKVVSSGQIYITLDNDYYTSDDYIVYSFAGGVVAYVNYDEDYDVTIKYDNDVVVTYYSLKEIYVDVMDRIERNDLIGLFDDRFRMIIMKDDEKVNYEDMYS